MSKIAQEDRRRLLEARRDLEHTRDPAKVCADARFHGALTASWEDLTLARAALLSAARALQVEQGQTQHEALALAEARREVELDYAYIRKKAQDALLNPSPRQRPSAEVLQQRQRLFDRAFPLTPTDLGRVAVETLLERLQELSDLMQAEEALQRLRDQEGELLAGFLTQSLATFQERLQTWQREQREDSDALRALRGARAAFDRVQRAHNELIASQLRREDRLAEASQLLIAFDSAYQSRLRAGRPLEEEPDSGELDGELTDPPPGA